MSELPTNNELKKTIPWNLLVILIMFSAGIVLTGIFYYGLQKRRIFKEQEEALAAIASLKINQIVNWHNERLSDAKVIKNDEPLISSISHFFANKNKDIKFELNDWMESVINEYDYRNVLIVDTSLKVRLSVILSDSILGESIKKEIKKTLKVENVIMTDLHRSEEVPYIHLDLLIPLFDSVNKKRVAVGVAIFRIDPAKILFPLIKSWPTPSKSSETLLLRREGDSVLYLNELRHSKNTALKLKLPLSNKNLLGTKAANGFEGVAEGIDYRNIPVIGSLSRIPDTSWFMVAKVDKEELLAPLKRYVLLITLVIILLILINASIFASWIWQQRIKFYRNELDNEKRFRNTLDNMMEGCQILGFDWKYLYINNVAEEHNRRPKEDMIGKVYMDVWPGIEETKLFSLIKSCLETRVHYHIENEFAFPDGTEGWFDLNIQPVLEGVFILSIDITDRKRSEKILRESEHRLRRFYEAGMVGVIYWNVAGQITEANDKFLEIVGYTRNDLETGKIDWVSMTPAEYKHLDDASIVELLATGENKAPFEKEYIRKDGSRVSILLAGAMLDETRYNGVAFILDITDLKKVEKDLRESEKLFRNLFENMLNGFAYCKMINEEGQPLDFLYLNVNKAFAVLTGLKDVTGKKASEAIPGIQESDPELLERYNRVSSSGIPEVFETYVESLKMWFAISLYSPQKGYFVAIFDVITARKLAEEKLQESKATLKSIIDNSNSLIYLVDTEGRFVMVNQHLQNLLSLSGEILIGQTREAFLPKEIVDIHRKNDLEVIRTGKTNVFEEENNEPDGKHFYLTTKFPLFNDQNEIYGVGGLSTDITERKLTENVLRENEKRLREAQEMAHLGFWLWDIKTGDVDWSDEVYKIFCLDPETFTPKIDSILELSPWPENNQRDKELIARAMEDHTPGDYEQKFLRPDLSIGHYYSTFRGNYDDTGKLMSIVGTVLDITERKKAEEALRESEAKYKTLVENIPQKIFMKDRDYRFISINKNFARDLGISPEEIVGKVDHDFFSRELADKYRADDVRIFKTGETEELEEKYMLDGKETWVNTIKTPVRDKNNEIVGVLGVFWDITERKRAEEMIIKLNEELELKVKQRTELLEAANKELEAFSYSVSHDLRAPLRSVHGFTKILLEDYESKLDDEGKRICGIISSSATQMGGLIDDLLSFSRIGRSTLNPSVIDVKKTVRVIFEGMTSPAERARIKLNIGKIAKAFGDVTLLGQVWTNLISNAIKYTSKNDVPEINIGSKTEGEMITYFIKDNGVGFDMQYRHKLFGVFQRLHSEAEFEGNGVGLAIVQRIILKHEGKVWAEGEVGKGATFYFSLPVQDRRQK